VILHLKSYFLLTNRFSIKGIKPDNFNKVDNEDVKELIGLCIQWKKDQRPTVKELLNHNIFMENNGLRLDVLRDEKKFIAFEGEGIITFRLKIIDKGRRKFIWAENELIEFNFDVDKEDPEEVIKELVNEILVLKLKF
jgi:WNK lysine deficient protein kinase